MNFPTYAARRGPETYRYRPDHVAHPMGKPAQHRRPAVAAATVCLALFSLILLLGCVAAHPSASDVTYYTLEYPPPPADSRHRTLPVVLGVERFQSAPYYHSDRMLYREKNYRRDAYHYHRWRVDPGDLVTDLLIRDWQSSGRFKAVIGTAQPLGSTHAIAGAVEDFYEEDGPEGWKAVLSLSITLVDESEPNRAAAVIYQKNYAASEPCRQRNPRAVAEAMSRALAQVSRRILEDVYAALDSGPGGRND
jgi:cholesterol transport system auxiliary component